LAEQLEAADGAPAERARALGEAARLAAEEDHDPGFMDRLEAEAIDFEADHPDLAAVIRRAVELLGSAGL